MRGKILFVAGIAVGYVLGAKAGRERYEQIRAGAQRLWNQPTVQRQVEHVEEFVKDKTPEVVEFVADGVKTVASKVQQKRSSTSSASKSTARSSASKSSGSTRAKPATRSSGSKSSGSSSSSSS